MPVRSGTRNPACTARCPAIALQPARRSSPDAGACGGGSGPPLSAPGDQYARGALDILAWPGYVGAVPATANTTG